MIRPRWRKVVEMGGPLPRPRHGHRAVAIKDLIIVFGGGSDGIVDDVSVYNTASKEWFLPKIQGEVPSGRAAYGIVCDEELLNIYIFGGMAEFGRYTDDLFELQAKHWVWRRLKPIASTIGSKYTWPCPRIGHTFTLTQNKICYIFGGLANLNAEDNQNNPKYLNDLYELDLTSKLLQWRIPKTYGVCPTPRESHTTVYWPKKHQIIIYGGMDGNRLNDVWILDLSTMNWSNPSIGGPCPEPRSLHTANIVDHTMYIFGGWVPSERQNTWACTSSLAVFDLDTQSWLQIPSPFTDDNEGPGPRAGHCSVVINNRIYIWSGRDGYHREKNCQVCYQDIWILELEPPPPPAQINLIRSSPNSLELSWSAVPTADYYLLQVQKHEVSRIFRLTRTNQSSSSPSQRPGGPRLFPLKPSVAPHPNQFNKTILVTRPVLRASTSPHHASPPILPTDPYLGSLSDQQQPANKVLALEQQNDAYHQSFAPSATTYSIPKTSTVDTMPQNILDEAFTEAENYMENNQNDSNVPRERQLVSSLEIDSISQICASSLPALEAGKDMAFQNPLRFDKNMSDVECSSSAPDSTGTHLDGKDKDESGVDVSEFLTFKSIADDETHSANNNNLFPYQGFDPFRVKSSPVSEDRGRNMSAALHALQQLADISADEQPQKSYETDNNFTNGSLPIHDIQQQHILSSSYKQDANDGIPPTVQQNESRSFPMPLIQPKETSSPPKLQKEVYPVAEIPANTYISEVAEGPTISSESKPITTGSMAVSTSGVRKLVYQQVQPWYDVGLVEGTDCVVSHYFVPTEMIDQSGRMIIRRIALEASTNYRFRIASVNGCGEGRWSQSFNFKSSTPGFPSTVTTIKINRVPRGAHITWEPPPNVNVQEYTVYLAVHPSNSQPNIAAEFEPIYVDQDSNCIVTNQTLKRAYFDTSKPNQVAIIFRIAAKNERGWGPATQVRWLQDNNFFVSEQYYSQH